MNRLTLLLLMMFGALGTAWAQTPALPAVKSPDLKSQLDSPRFEMDSAIEAQLAKKKELNKLKPATVEGFRVQVYAGNSRQQALQIRTDVLAANPDFAAYLIYKQPTFRVRVGDFKTRYEAQKLLNELKSIYPASFIVPDEVLVNPVLAPKPVEPILEDAERTDP